jgi:hypothetical protein
MAATQVHMTAAWKMAKSDESTAKPEKGEPKMKERKNV